MSAARRYPAPCLSANCGRLACDGCPHLPRLEQFKAWRERTQAQRLDEVWSPTTWTATRPDPRPELGPEPAAPGWR